MDENLPGDDSKIIMDRALHFIKNNVMRQKPSLSVIWFHTPHTPIVAGFRHRTMYADLTIQEQHWYGCITAMDEQIGRLRNRLRDFGISDNTVVWFCSDNGPSYVHNYNSAGPFRGKKATLYEGGIRVPAVLEWPAKFSVPKIIAAPVCTSDLYPTLLNVAGVKVKEQPLLDGIDIMPILEGMQSERPVFIAFQSPIRGASWDKEPGKKQLALIDNRYKIITVDSGDSYQLYDLLADPGETRNLADKQPKRSRR